MRRIEIVLDERYNRSNCYECAQVTMEGEDGVKQSRLVTVASLVEAFMKSAIMMRQWAAGTAGIVPK